MLNLCSSCCPKRPLFNDGEINIAKHENNSLDETENTIKIPIMEDEETKAEIPSLDRVFLKSYFETTYKQLL